MAQYREKTLYESFPALRYVLYAITALLLSVMHVVFVRLISVQGIAPDLFLVLDAWIALAEGQFIALYAGFICGLLFDVVSADVLGTNALAKTMAGFTAGFFFRHVEIPKSLGGMRLLLAVGVSSFIHNLAYFFFYVRPTEMSFTGFFLQYGIATTLYTVVAALFPMLIYRSTRLVR